MASKNNKYALIRVENSINPIERKEVVSLLFEYTSLNEAEFDFRNHPNYLEDGALVTFYVVQTNGLNLANLEREQFKDKIILDHKQKVDNTFISRVTHRYAIIKVVYHNDYKDSEKQKSSIIAQYSDLNQATKELAKLEETVIGAVHTTYCLVDLKDHLGEEVDNLNIVIHE